MSSKSKDVRIEQRRILEKKLDLRLQKLAQKGISKEKAQSDPLVKSLKSKIRETNVRIAAAEKFVQRNADLAQAKAEKLAAPPKKKEKHKAKPAKEKGKEPVETKSKPQLAAPAQVKRNKNQKR